MDIFSTPALMLTLFSPRATLLLEPEGLSFVPWLYHPYLLPHHAKALKNGAENCSLCMQLKTCSQDPAPTGLGLDSDYLNIYQQAETASVRMCENPEFATADKQHWQELRVSHSRLVPPPQHMERHHGASTCGITHLQQHGIAGTACSADPSKFSFLLPIKELFFLSLRLYIREYSWYCQNFSFVIDWKINLLDIK